MTRRRPRVASGAAGDEWKKSPYISACSGQRPALRTVQISEWTGIPVAKLTADEASGMLDLEGQLHERVIGQDKAVHS